MRAALRSTIRTRLPDQALTAGEDSLAAQARRAAYLHLATHGFFADVDRPQKEQLFAMDLRAQTLFATESTSQLRGATVAGRNPLLLAGVVLAGANLPPQTDELGLPTGHDGILLAEEVLALDLRNTDLVVLSACETGLGELAGHEGLFGLQRAFHQAGARSVVGSLWKVEDAATQALMEEFYRNLWGKKLSKVEALRAAQWAMIRGYDRQAGVLRGTVGPLKPEVPVPAAPAADRAPLPPFFWAAFVLSGDWR